MAGEREKEKKITISNIQQKGMALTLVLSLHDNSENCAFFVNSSERD